MTVVEIATGKVSGIAERGVVAFKGIPYAAPPVGERRFAPTADPEPWTGVRECSSFGATALQAAFDLDKFMGAEGLRADEDCLTLNVWTPACDDARRPVMVWIHGGAFFSGSSAIPWYNGGGLARGGDVVVVSINYRLGAFGFAYLDHLLGDRVAGSANAGLLDQIKALEWVGTNIAAFGGDPDNVTVFGESAGGMSIGTLLGTPAAAGRFHKAIAQSGACQAIAERDDAMAVTARLLGHLGLAEGDAARLFDLPAAALAEAQNAVVAELFESAVDNARRGSLGMPFQPVADGVVIDQHPLEAVAAGASAEVPLLLGTTRDEMRLFTLMAPHMADRHAYERVGLADAYRSYESRRPDAEPFDVLNDLLTDYVFRIPAIRLAEAHGPSTHMYRFDWQANVLGLDLRAFHGVELLFCFDNVRMPGVEMLFGERVDAAHALAARTSQAWTAFARTGDPGWGPYEPERRATMVFDAVDELVDDPDGDDRRVWDPLR